jgi:thiamine-monophosphate kinase
MLDLSDGIASDARRIAAASGVGLRLDARRLPVDAATAAVAAALGRPAAELAATGGEDFELLVCVPPAARAAAEAAAGLTWIGEVVAGGDEPLAWSGAPAGAAAWRGFEHG